MQIAYCCSAHYTPQHPILNLLGELLGEVLRLRIGHRRRDLLVNRREEGGVAGRGKTFSLLPVVAHPTNWLEKVRFVTTHRVADAANPRPAGRSTSMSANAIEETAPTSQPGRLTSSKRALRSAGLPLGVLHFADQTPFPWDDSVDLDWSRDWPILPMQNDPHSNHAGDAYRLVSISQDDSDWQVDTCPPALPLEAYPCSAFDDILHMNAADMSSWEFGL